MAEISTFLAEHVGTAASLPLEIDAEFFEDAHCQVCGATATFYGVFGPVEGVADRLGDGILLCDTCASLIVLRDEDGLVARLDIEPDEDESEHRRTARDLICGVEELIRPVVGDD